MLIIVRTMNGMSFVVDLMPNDTIETLKTIIEDMNGFPYKQQIIQLNGIILSDNKTLSDYNISDDTIVQLVIRWTQFHQ